jgi:Tol biopolymer transport system component
VFVGALALSHEACGQAQNAAHGWNIGRSVVQNIGRMQGHSANLKPLTWVVSYDANDDILVVEHPGATPHKIADGNDPALSPDGGVVAFCAVPTGGMQTEIMLVKADGTGLKRLTNLNAGARAPVWSPDGHKIAFHAEISKGEELLVLDFDKKSITPIAKGMYPRWSPDGKRIVFLRAQEGDGRKLSIWVAKADGSGELKVAATDSRFPSAAWSADGKEIVYSSDDRHRSAIFRVPAAGGEPEEIARDSNMEMYYPSLSPDSRSLAVVTDNDQFRSVEVLDLATHKSSRIAYGSEADVRWVRSN